jgi:hypothetical protein
VEQKGEIAFPRGEGSRGEPAVVTYVPTTTPADLLNFRRIRLGKGVAVLAPQDTSLPSIQKDVTALLFSSSRSTPR